MGEFLSPAHRLHAHRDVLAAHDRRVSLRLSGSVVGLADAGFAGDRGVRTSTTKAEKAESDRLKRWSRWLTNLFCEIDHERAYFLFLDQQGQVAGNVSFDGIRAEVGFDLPLIFRSALRRNAVQIMMTHNHPSGDVQPSKQDIHATRSFIIACRVIGLRCFDHIIWAEEAIFSFREEGLM